MFELLKEINTMLDNHEEGSDLFYWSVRLLQQKAEMSRYILRFSKAKNHYYLTKG